MTRTLSIEWDNYYNDFKISEIYRVIDHYNVDNLPVYVKIKKEYQYDSYTVQDSLNNLLKSKNIYLPSLPRRCKFVEIDNDIYYFVIELPPDKFKIKYKEYNEYEDEYNIIDYTLVMPWQYFITSFSKAPSNYLGVNWSFCDLKLLWSSREVTSIDATFLNVAGLPNMDGDGHVCLGNTAPSSDGDLAERVNELVASFFTESVFNDEMGLEYLPDDLKSWERHSLADFSYWKRITGSPTFSLRGMMDLSNDERHDNPAFSNILSDVITSLYVSKVEREIEKPKAVGLNWLTQLWEEVKEPNGS